MSGISALLEETSRSSLASLLPCKDTEKSAVWILGESSCWHPDLGLSASRVVSNKFLLFISQPVNGTS